MKIYLHTYGCRANQYDTEAVRAMSEGAGHTIVGSPAEADVAVFNSCAVTASAEADLRQGVRRAARANPSLRSVVMGCAAALDRGEIRALPTVSHVVAGADLDSLADALAITPSPDLGVLTRRQSTARAVLRIQDGCDEHCTFCATTVARGPARSRRVEALVAEALSLSTHHAEIVLTGIHIGSWGVDHAQTLSALVEALVRHVPHVRFRLSSLEASEVDARLASLLRSGELAPYLHAPLQSGSNRVLRRMGRHWYTAGSYEGAVTALVQNRDVFGLGADVICGFPGETDEDHAATLALVERLPFTYLHVFPFSIRAGTPAARMGPAVCPSVTERRAADLRQLAAKKARAYRERRAGGVADVVVTRGGRQCEGMTEDFLTVAVTPPAPRGTRLRARVTIEGERLLAIPL